MRIRRMIRIYGWMNHTLPLPFLSSIPISQDFFLFLRTRSHRFIQKIRTIRRKKKCLLVGSMNESFPLSRTPWICDETDGFVMQETISLT